MTAYKAPLLKSAVNQADEAVNAQTMVTLPTTVSKLANTRYEGNSQGRRRRQAKIKQAIAISARQVESRYVRSKERSLHREIESFYQVLNALLREGRA